MRHFTFLLFLVAGLPIMAQTSSELRPWQVAVDSSKRPIEISNCFSAAPEHCVRLSLAPGEPALNAVITQVPDGEITWYTRNSIALYEYWGMAYDTPDYGCQGKFVDPGDGSVYIMNPISQYGDDGYIIGYYNDNKDEITIPGNQIVYDEMVGDPGSEIRNVYGIMAMELGDDGWGGKTYVITEENTYTLRRDGDKWVSANPDILLGLCWYFDGEWLWPGFGDRDMVYSPIDGLGKVLPANLEFQPWLYSTNDAYALLNVAVDKENAKMYIQNILDNNAPYCLEGNIKGNCVSFPSGQFMGASGKNEHWGITYGCRLERKFNEDRELWYTDIIPEQSFDCLYDEQVGMIVNLNSLLVGSNITDNYDDIVMLYYMPDFRIVPRQFDYNAPPAKPYSLRIYYLDDYETEGSFMFYLPDTNVKGQFINTAYMYWKLYIDNEPVEFLAEENKGLFNDTEEIPYSWSNNSTVISWGDLREVYFALDGFDSFGVQAIYRDGDREMVSEIATYYLNPAAAIDSVNPDALVILTEYFDLQGNRISNPVKGIYIVKRVFNNGQVEVNKMIGR